MDMKRNLEKIKMRMAIVGSRNWKDQGAIRKFLADLPSDTIIISGGAAGVDTMAEHFATERGLATEILKPDWNKNGKSAGILRNYDIVAKSEYVVAFWDGKSNGTKHTIDTAIAAPHIKGLTIFVDKNQK
jgi:hypothetical protein